MERLEEARNLLVRRWGELGGYWGVSRTMAEIHALLFVSREPLCTDDVMQRLKISRGNASTNLRSLVDWGLIERVHKLGDRKEYFSADKDIWRMFETIMRERRRREVEPIIATLDRCWEMVGDTASSHGEKDRGGANHGARESTEAATNEDVAEFRRRVEELRRFLSGMGALFESLLTLGDQGAERLVRSMADGARKPPQRSARASRA